jgi:hypothetical protein
MIMPPEAIAALITGAGVAGVWVVTILAGWCSPGWVVKDKDQEIAELKAAVESQTRRADAAIEATHTMNLILAGLRKETGQ